MARHPISLLDLEELKNLSYYLFDNHYEIAKSKKIEKKVGSATLKKLAAVLNQTYNYVQTLTPDKGVSSKAYDLFKEKFDRVIKEEIKSADSSMIERYKIFRKKIDGYYEDPTKVEFFHILNQFSNLTWFIYESLPDERVGRSLIKFKEITNQKLNIEIEIYGDKNSPHLGSAYVDSKGDFLVLQTIISKEIHALPINYLIRVDKEITNYDEVNLVIGHRTGIDSTNKIINSRVVFFSKCPKSSTTTILNFNDSKLKSPTEEVIYSYFVNSVVNNIDTPYIIPISNLEQLKTWLDEKFSSKKASHSFPAIGNYKVYYQDNESDEVIEDKLEIKLEDNGELIGIYTHKVLGGDIQIHKGQVKYSQTSRAAYMTLEGQSPPIIKGQNNLIFFILNIPSGIEKLSILTGIASGVRDGNTGALSFLVVVQKTGSQSENEIDTLAINNGIRKFFSSYNKGLFIDQLTVEVGNITQLLQCVAKK